MCVTDIVGPMRVFSMYSIGRVGMLSLISVGLWRFKFGGTTGFFQITQFTKGQLISKCLFGVFNFFQKMNENKWHTNIN